MNVGIAGAGLIGRLIAWRLLREGHQVTLFDRDTQAAELSAAKVAAAMIAPYSEVVNCEREIFTWGLQSLERWPQWLAQLAQDAGITVYFQQQGSVVVAHHQDQSQLAHFNQLLRSRVPDHLDEIEFLNHSKLQSLEPVLAERFSSGTYLQQEACLDNWTLLKALAEAIHRLGGQWHTGADIQQLSPFTLTTGANTHRFDLVIDSRGFGARPDIDDLRGVRGEVLWVKAPEVTLNRPVRLMHPRYQLYIAPKPDDIYVIGATEIESESMEPITVRSSLELQSALYSITTGFAEATLLKAYANCRPAYRNNLPRIDSEPGLLRINGLYRHGYLLSPLVISTAMKAIHGDASHAIVNVHNDSEFGVSA